MKRAVFLGSSPFAVSTTSYSYVVIFDNICQRKARRVPHSPWVPVGAAETGVSSAQELATAPLPHFAGKESGAPSRPTSRPAADCQLLLYLSRERLVVTNTSKPFSKKGLTSLVISDCSPKQLERNRFIVCKGLGFRSILIWTGRLSFKIRSFSTSSGFAAFRHGGL